MADQTVPGFDGASFKWTWQDEVVMPPPPRPKGHLANEEIFEARAAAMKEAVMRFMLSWNGDADLGSLESLEADIARLMGVTTADDGQHDWAHAFNKLVGAYPAVAEELVEIEGTPLARSHGLLHHRQVDCRGGHCPFHAPSDHPLNDSPMNLRSSGLIERMCEHGIGHPDPDSVAFMKEHGQNGFGVHGCDGCCRS
jgi:hypothetical protein